jgi:hypothetical protein
MNSEISGLKLQVDRAETDLEQAEDELEEAEIQMAKQKRVSDHRITVALCKIDKKISSMAPA